MACELSRVARYGDGSARDVGALVPVQPDHTRPDGSQAESAAALTLTARQLECLVHATRPNWWIAARLGIKPQAVRNHFQRINRRLGIRAGGGRCAALMKALARGVIALGEVDPADDERRPLPTWHWEWVERAWRT